MLDLTLDSEFCCVKYHSTKRFLIVPLFSPKEGRLVHPSAFTRPVTDGSN